MWLNKNSPYVLSTNISDLVDSDPYHSIPFLPGKVSPSKNSLPEFSKHNDGKNNYVDNFDVKAQFGSAMAKQVQLSLMITASAESFVISDSTYPGDGALKIAHVMPQVTSTYENLQGVMGNLINFGNFGIPNTGF